MMKRWTPEPPALMVSKKGGLLEISGHGWKWYLRVLAILETFGNHILDSDDSEQILVHLHISQWDCRYSPTKEMFVWTCLAPLWWLINMNHHYPGIFWWSSPFSDTLMLVLGMIGGRTRIHHIHHWGYTQLIVCWNCKYLGYDVET